ncbi:hypothetical protein Xszus_03769 [Xenorhabdus szentirmaii]|nr:hypothetical protein Xszus_03769 [Xenorhabdus szentirmaii]
MLSPFSDFPVIATLLYSNAVTILSSNIFSSAFFFSRILFFYQRVLVHLVSRIENSKKAECYPIFHFIVHKEID